MRRRGIGHRLNRRVDIWRVTRTPDGGGGTSDTWGPVHEQVPARMSQPHATERERAERSGAELSHQVYFRPGTDVRRHDEVRVGGRRFTVLWVVEPSIEIYKRADCREHQPEGGAT